MSTIEGTSSATSNALSFDPSASRPATYLGGADLATRVMALRAATRSEEQENAVDDVREAAETRRAQMEERLQQMLRAAADREDAGFWSGVADVAKVVGIVAAAVVGVAGAAFSGGTSAVAAAAVIAALTAAQLALPYVAGEIAEACGASERTKMWLQLGVSLACIALSLLCPTGTTSAVADAAARIAQAGGQAVSGGARIASAVNTIESGQHEASAKRHEAMATAADNGVREGLDDIQVVLDRAARASRQAIAIMMAHNDGTEAALRA